MTPHAAVDAFGGVLDASTRTFDTATTERDHRMKEPVSRAAEVDVQVALHTPLAGIDGRVSTLAERFGNAGGLFVVVERDCPTSQGALRALASAGGTVSIVSQGRPQAAQDLIADTGAQNLDIVVEPAPHPVSAALAADTVPTFVLVEGGSATAHLEGWDRDAVAALLLRVGGELTADGGLPDVKPGCQSRHTFDPTLQAQLEADDAELSGGDGRVEDLWDLGWHDGLPVVPPTRERVRAMLDGRDPSTSLGILGPVNGEVTFERLAACAVLAGCDPTYWPLVEAAARAVLDPRFNPHGVTNTTSWATPWIIVNGPIRHEIGMNAGSNVIGPGNRANATTGRAIRLLLQLTGGGSPGGLDQSALGGQHKFTACFPEREEASPFEPLHASLGFDPGSSAVTVLAGEPPAGVADHNSQSPEQLASTLAAAVGNAVSPTMFPLPGGETLLILCTEHARSFGAAGWTRRDLTDFIVEHSARTAGELRATGSGVVTAELAAAKSPDEIIPKLRSPDALLIAVAGGDAGRFSAVVGPWGRSSGMVTRALE